MPCWAFGAAHMCDSTVTTARLQINPQPESLLPSLSHLAAAAAARQPAAACQGREAGRPRRRSLAGGSCRPVALTSSRCAALPAAAAGCAMPACRSAAGRAVRQGSRKLRPTAPACLVGTQLPFCAAPGSQHGRRQWQERRSKHPARGEQGGGGGARSAVGLLALASLRKVRGGRFAQ